MEQQINAKALTVLEYHKITSMLADCAGSPPAAALCAGLTPSADYDEAERLLRETSDAKNLIRLKGAPSFSAVKDITPHLRRLEIGGALSMGELLDLAHVLRVANSLIKFRGDNASLAPSLDVYFGGLLPNKYLEERILTSIVSEEEMADNASSELYDLRRRIIRAEMKVKDVLNHLIHSQAYKKYLQDGLVTVKNGRYVVPVKSECRGEVQGLVHDSSASGATVFVEPLGVVEANNEIRILKGKEQAEIERILAELSAEAARFAESIRIDYEFLVELDVIFAKAKLSDQMRAEPPVLNKAGAVTLKKARHPLLDRNQAVPIDISVGKDFDALIITGPNTGGKTVSLKTAGLLVLMAQSGLHIPAAEGSELPVFSSVFADIGDEQSIEQSLSTFSSHMTNIVTIIQEAGENSLVLFDELGAGTDPVEGAALAIAIIEHVRGTGARLIATTHYPELKIYALETAGVENASCEFDVQSLRPTYRLITGVPGRSNAFAIASRLGISPDIIERAQLHLSSESVKFERVIENLERNRTQMEFESKKASEFKREAERLQREAQEMRDKLEKSMEKELEKARGEAKRVIETTKADSRRILEELEELRRQKDSEDFRDQLNRVKAGITQSVRAAEERADPVRRPDESYTLPRPLVIGDTVKISGINKEATVLSLPDGGGYLTVKAGIMNTKVKLEDIRLVEKPKANAPKGYASRSPGNKAAAEVRTELDIRGMAGDEAEYVIDAFLDSNVMSGLKNVTIIHGKGTGALRAAVHKHLRGHPHVRTFRLGTFGEGEAGVTVVELK